MSHDPDPTNGHDVATESVRIQTSDGVDLEAEVAGPAPLDTIPPGGVAVVCHPHPLHGGSMHANVVEALFRSLPPAGAAVVRFNFRGAGGSSGTHDNGDAEQLDVKAAIEYAVGRWPGANLVLAGYSFGADVSLAVDVADVSGWLAIAPPLRIIDRDKLIALNDQRPKTLVGATHDQFNPYSDLVASTDALPNVTVVEAEGADHFFAVGLDRVVEAGKISLGLD